MQEEIFEKYYKDGFGQYEGMPDYSTLTQQEKERMSKTMAYSVFALSFQLRKLAWLIVEPVFKFIERIFKL